MDSGDHHEKLNRRLLVGILFGLLAVVVICGGLWSDSRVPKSVVTTILIASVAGLGGFVLAICFFLSNDEDLKPFRSLILGALSGISLIQAKALYGIIQSRFNDLASAQHQTGAVAFFVALSAGLIGLLVGFFFVRFWLAHEVAYAQSALTKIVAGMGQLQAMPWVELRGEFAEVGGELPDDKAIDELAKRTDWTSAAPVDAMRAGAILLFKKKPGPALLALEHALSRAESPSPIAFDLYAAALVDEHAKVDLPPDKVRDFERQLVRMLTYHPNSYLVNLDAGYLYLYAPGQAAQAEFYSRKALESRPQSPSANLNLACALAAKMARSLPSAADVGAVTAALDIYLDVKKVDWATLNGQHDFDELAGNLQFQAWMKERGLSAIRRGPDVGQAGEAEPAPRAAAGGK